MFVGAVATTLTFASLGLVAVAGGAGTAATAGQCFASSLSKPYDIQRLYLTSKARQDRAC